VKNTTYVIKYIAYNNQDYEQSYHGYYKKECMHIAKCLANIKHVSNVRIYHKGKLVQGDKTCSESIPTP
jgi:hypothetical protein